MSFTGEIKRELGAIAPHKACCERAVLATLYALLSEERRNELSLKTENITVARRIIILSRRLLGLELDADIRSNRSKTRKQILVTVSKKEDIKLLKEGLRLVSDKADIFHSRIDPAFSVNTCCKYAILQAAFLACGFINNPKKAYHLEISTHKKQVFSDLLLITEELGLEMKTITRQNKYVMYLKNNEQICDFLNILGIKRGLFLYHEIKLEKELKNDINRQMNFENANENKRIDAALSQIKALKKLEKSKKKETLSPQLLEAMELRLSHPTLSLSELAEVSPVPISKSGLNHRLKKLMQLAETL